MKIKPVIRGPKNYCDFSELDEGGTFIYSHELCVKIVDIDSDYKQCAVNLSSGELHYDMCYTQVLPVDAVITWTKQKK
jgi:hypothetical protein